MPQPWLDVLGVHEGVLLVLGCWEELSVSPAMSHSWSLGEQSEPLRLSRDDRRFWRKNVSYENLIWDLLCLGESRISAFTHLSWSQLDQAGCAFARKSARCCECLGSPAVPTVFSLWMLPEWLVKGGAEMTRPRFLIRRAALDVCGNTAGHQWIPRGDVGKQSLVQIFLSILERCFPRTMILLL